MLLSSVFWACFDFQRKALTQRFEPARLAIIFTLFALPCYLGFWVNQGMPTPSWGAYLLPATLSGMFAAIGSLHYLKALQHGYISQVIPILCLTPVIAGGFGAIYLAEPLSLLDWLAIATISTICFLLTTKTSSSSNKALGYAIVTAISWGMCIVFDKQALSVSPLSFHLVFLSLLIVGLTYLTLRPLLGLQEVLLNKQIWLAVGVFMGAISLQLLALNVEHPGIVEATKRAIGMISALFVGYWYFKEKITKPQILLTFALILCLWLLV